MTLSPSRLATGNGLPVSIDSSTALDPFRHEFPSNRDLLAWTYAQQVADVDMRQGNVFPPHHWLQFGRAVFGASFSKDLIAAEVWARARSSSTWPQQGQGDNHRGGLRNTLRPAPST